MAGASEKRVGSGRGRSASDLHAAASGPSMRRFLVKLACWVPLAGAMACVNWRVDPGRFFVGNVFDSARNEYEAALIADLRGGRPHRMAAVYNERLVLEQVFRDRPRLNVLVFGSSVAKPVSGDLYPGKTFFNASIYGGDLEEAIAAYEVARECGQHPKRIVLQLQGYGRLLGKRLERLENGFGPLFERARQRIGVESEEPDADTLAA